MARAATSSPVWARGALLHTDPSLGVRHVTARSVDASGPTLATGGVDGAPR